MKKIIFFSEYLYPADNSTAYLFTDIVKTGADVFDGNGAVVTSTTLPENIHEFTVPENFLIKRFKVCNFDKNKSVHRILKFFYITFMFAWYSLRLTRKRDIVFGVTNPAFCVFVFAVMKRVLGFKYILLTYDIFPENALATKLISVNSFVYRICKKAFDWAYSQVDYAVAIGRDMAEVLKFKGVPQEKIILIPNWADPEKVLPSDKSENPIIKKLGWEQKKVFMFAGNIGAVQGIENLLQGIEQLNRKDAAFLFVGTGKMLPEVKQFQEAHPEINIFCTGAMPMAEQNIFLNACDVAIVTLEKNFYGLGVPSKSYFYMASRRPILYIGEKESEIALCVKENNIGWVVEPDNSNALVRQLNNILSLPEQELRQLGERSRCISESEYSVNIALQKYKNFFIRIKES